MTNIHFNSEDSGLTDSPTIAPRTSYNDDIRDNDNVLDSLKKIIQDKVRRPDVYINVPERPGVLVRISPNISQNQL